METTHLVFFVSKNIALVNRKVVLGKQSVIFTNFPVQKEEILIAIFLITICKHLGGNPKNHAFRKKFTILPLKLLLTEGENLVISG